MTAAARLAARSTARAPLAPAADATLWRCGGRSCGAGECDHDDGALHRRASGPGPAYAPPVVHDVLRGPGAPLPPGLRGDMEARLGHDLSDVRIHDDATAHRSAAAVHAHAYTVGRQVVFGRGGFDPATGAGRRLLAHELTHAAAGTSGRSAPGRLRISSPDQPHEVHAERVSHRLEDRAGPSSTPDRPADSVLHRAAYVCDEYRTRPSGTASPGPGISVSYSGQRVTVDAALSITGPEADAPTATTIQDNVARRWTSSFPDGYAISTRVAATARPEGGGGSATEVELVRSGTRPSYRSRHWLVGSPYVSLNLDRGAGATDYTVAHEFGHLLGLGDRYSEGMLSRLGGMLFGSQRSTTPEPGYEDNIMARSEGQLESTNVRDLITRHAASDCVRGHLESPL